MPDAVHRPWITVPPSDAMPEGPVLAQIFSCGSRNDSWNGRMYPERLRTNGGRRSILRSTADGGNEV